MTALAALAALGASSTWAVESAESAPTVEIDHRGVRVVGLPSAELETAARLELRAADWREILRVTAVEAGSEPGSPEPPDPSLPALLGSFDVVPELGALRFRPRFAPASGLVLHARFHGAAWARSVGSLRIPRDAEARFLVPEPVVRERARVRSVVPSGEVPSNLLRFYVHFSEPMSARHVLDHIELLDPSGTPIQDAFVEVPGGLWDRERTRLTLFVHPGRVKRGVGPNQAVGPVFEAGGRYRLQVASTARDAVGRELGESFESSLQVGPPDRRSPDPKAWRFIAPNRPTDPLIVELDEPADAALLGRLLEVESLGAGVGGDVAVDVTVEGNGRRVRLQPRGPWGPGAYRLLVPVALEDPSGNRVDRLFEEAPASSEEGGPPVALPFTLRFDGESG